MNVFFALVLSLALVNCAKLLKKPKIYNALITTDESLSPSRAFPLIQPVIQPAVPVFTPFYQTNYYEPFGRSSNDVGNDGERDLKNDLPIERKSDDPIELRPVNDQSTVDESQSDLQQNTAKPSLDKPKDEKSPIPLNEYGFPPSLIPLQKYPTYPYNFPFIYDSYGNIQAVQQYPVIPPSFFPQQQNHQLPPLEQPLFTVGARKLDVDSPRDQKSVPENNENRSPLASNDAIRNYANKNSDIPDAEIPPIPFTIKKND